MSASGQHANVGSWREAAKHTNMFKALMSVLCAFAVAPLVPERPAPRGAETV